MVGDSCQKNPSPVRNMVKPPVTRNKAAAYLWLCIVLKGDLT